MCWISSSKTWYWAWVWAWHWAQAWLDQWIKPSQAELELLYFITSSSLNIICRLVSSSSQALTFYFCYRAELEHSLLDKARFIYSMPPPHLILYSLSRFYSVIYDDHASNHSCFLHKLCLSKEFFVSPFEDDNWDKHALFRLLPQLPSS